MSLNNFTELIKNKKNKYEVIDIISPITRTNLSFVTQEKLALFLEEIEALKKIDEILVYEEIKSYTLNYVKE